MTSHVRTPEEVQKLLSDWVDEYDRHDTVGSVLREWGELAEIAVRAEEEWDPVDKLALSLNVGDGEYELFTSTIPRTPLEVASETTFREGDFCCPVCRDSIGGFGFDEGMPTPSDGWVQDLSLVCSNCGVVWGEMFLLCMAAGATFDELLPSEIEMSLTRVWEEGFADGSLDSSAAPLCLDIALARNWPWMPPLETLLDSVSPAGIVNVFPHVLYAALNPDFQTPTEATTVPDRIEVVGNGGSCCPCEGFHAHLLLPEETSATDLRERFTSALESWLDTADIGTRAAPDTEVLGDEQLVIDFLGLAPDGSDFSPSLRRTVPADESLSGTEATRLNGVDVLFGDTANLHSPPPTDVFVPLSGAGYGYSPAAD